MEQIYKLDIDQNNEVERVWNEFWKDIVTKEDGTIDLEQIKKELADFHFIMDQVPEVYCHITGGLLSKLTYKSSTVINRAEEHYKEMYTNMFKEDIFEFIGEDEEVLKHELIDFLKEYFS